MTTPQAPPATTQDPASTALPARRRISADTRSKYRFVALCLVPALLLYIVCMVWPTISVFRMSVFRWSGLSGEPEFVGRDNSRILAGDMDFVRAFQNTILLFVLATVVTLALALLLASLLT